MPKPLPPERQLRRAKRSLGMMLSAWSGALVSDSSLSDDYRAAVRSASDRARRALSQNELTPAEVVAQIIAPIFEVTGAARE